MENYKKERIDGEVSDDEEMLIQQAMKLSLQMAPPIIPMSMSKLVKTIDIQNNVQPMDLDSKNIILSNNEKKEIEKPKKKNRCANSDCGKKLNFSNGIECKCGDTFCMKHRFPYEHNCKFNHNKVHQDKLKNQLVKMEKEKIKDKI